MNIEKIRELRKQAEIFIAYLNLLEAKHNDRFLENVLFDKNDLTNKNLIVERKIKGEISIDFDKIK